MNGAASEATHPAGFWVRLAAFAIDLVVIGIAQVLLRVLAAVRFGAQSDQAVAWVSFFTFVFAVAYPTVLHAIAGQTLGKLATRVHVVALDGGLLPLGAAFLRAIAFWATLFLMLGIGHIIGGLRKDKRAFHDLIAGSRTERVPRAARARRAPRPVPAVVAEGAFPPPPAESEPRSSG